VPPEGLCTGKLRLVAGRGPLVELVDRSSEEDMIATFLQAGLGSPRATDRLRELFAERALDEDLVTAPDLTSDTGNRSRSELLGAWFGWPDRGLFEGLPVEDIDCGTE